VNARTILRRLITSLNSTADSVDLPPGAALFLFPRCPGCERSRRTAPGWLAQAVRLGLRVAGLPSGERRPAVESPLFGGRAAA
jgi:hypothetical protein